MPPLHTYGELLYLKNDKEGEVAYVYSDASSDVTYRIATEAAIVESNVGSIQQVRSSKFSPTITTVEAQALLFGLLLSKDLGYSRVVLHTDCQSLYRCLLFTEQEPSDLKAVLTQVRRKIKKFNEVRIVLVSRSILEDVHGLAITKLREIRNAI